VPNNRSLANYVEIALNYCVNPTKDRIIKSRGEDIPFIVEELSQNGKTVVGLTGKDLLREYELSKYNSKLAILKTVLWRDNNAMFGKPVLCLLGPKNKELEELPKNLKVCINSKYKNLSKKYLNLLEGKGYTFVKIYLSGSTEAAYSNGLSDLVIDIVYTGTSMKNANLRVYDRIFESDFVMIGTKGNLDNVKNIEPRKTIKEIQDYNPPIRNRTGKLRLDFNENTIGCSPKVIEALRKVTAEELSIYPEYNKFKEILSGYLNLIPSEVLLTNGTDEAIKTIFETYVEKGKDEIIIPMPTFAMFKFYAQLSEGIIKELPYNENLSFPTERVLTELNNKTKIVVLVNPNNPTGTSIKDADIIKILKKSLKNNVIVLIDEAYYQFYGNNSKNLIKKYDNLIITRTFSKAFGLAGLRLGYIISNEQIIKNLKKVISPYSVNSVVLVAGKAALDDTNFINDYISEVKENKKYINYELNRLGIKTIPSESNFLIANFEDKCNIVYRELKKRNILVRNLTQYPLLKDCLRIGIGTKDQCNKLIFEIKNILRKNVILFDMDGVLVDVSDSYRLAIKKTVEFFTNQEVSQDEIQNIKEKSGYNNDWDLTEEIITSRNFKIPKDKIIKKFQELYSGKNGFINNEKWILSKETLQELYKTCRLGIVTGRPKSEAYSALRKFEVLDFFDVVITMEDYPKEKPKPDPYSINSALKKLGNKNAVYIGDSIDDMEAARNAGIKAIGVIPPNIPGDRLELLLEQNGAKTVLKNINQIMGVLKWELQKLNEQQMKLRSI